MPKLFDIWLVSLLLGELSSPIVGGLRLFQCNGKHCLAALIRWSVSDFL